MKFKVFFYSALFIILISIFVLIIVNMLNSNSIENILEIKLSFKSGSEEAEEYIFKEKENILKLAKMEEELRTFKSEDDINMPYVDITFNIIYPNNKIVEKKYSIRPYRELFEEVLNSIEARKQNIWILNADTTNIEKLVLESNLKDAYVEITDKELINAMVKELQNYYLSDKYIIKDKYNTFIDSAHIKIRILPDEIRYILASDNESILEILREQGMYDDLIVNLNDVEKLFLTKDEKRIEINDKALMDLVLEKAYSGSKSTSCILVEVILKNTDKLYGSFLQGNVPVEIENLFNDL